MLKQIKKLAGETAIYGLSTVISSLLNIILIPIYTRIFLPADYGIINLVNVTFLFLYILVVFGLDNSTALWYWKYETEEERNKTFANWAFFQFFAASLISLILICFSSFFSLQLTGIPDYHLLFIIAA